MDDDLTRLQKLFPSAFSEGRLDFERLKLAVGAIPAVGVEKFTFSWAGRQDAVRLLQVPTQATLAADITHSVDFESSNSLYIAGENLESLKLLYKSWFDRIKVIYIDPPYNTGGDFVYKDDYVDPLANYLKLTSQRDDAGNLLVSNPETGGRFHSAWLTMMYPRLDFARRLLADDGVIFVSIDDTELPNLRLLLDQVFGPRNFIGTIVWITATDNNPTQIATHHEYILCYAKNYESQGDWERPSSKAKAILEKYKQLKERLGADFAAIEESLTEWIRAQEDGGEVDLRGVAHYSYVDEKGVFYPGNSANTIPGGYTFDIIHPKTGKVCAKPANGYRWPERTFTEARERGDVYWGEDELTVPKIKKRLETATELLRSTYYEDNRRATSELSRLMGGKVFENPKSPRLLRLLFEFTTRKDSTVLDFFAGSGTTAEAVLALNASDGGSRRFILIQWPEPTPAGSVARELGFQTVAEIGAERIRRVIAAMKRERSRPGPPPGVDPGLGFRFFQLAKSNFRPWKGVDERSAAAWTSEMEASLDSLLPGSEPLQAVFEVALKQGLSPTCRVQSLAEVAGNQVYRITDAVTSQTIFVCLDRELNAGAVRNLKLGAQDTFVCREIALSDTLAANLTLQCRLRTV